jgi:hypothetical protein
MTKLDMKISQENGKYYIELDYLPEVLFVGSMQGSGDNMKLYTESLFNGEQPNSYEVDADYKFDKGEVTDVDITLKITPNRK